MKDQDDGYTFAQTILDSISAHVVILDQSGIIMETNRAWKDFAAANQIHIRPDTLQSNYLEVCERAGQGEYSFVAAGIRDVIAGVKKEFVMDYPCHSGEEKRWFYMRVVRAAERYPRYPLRIVVSHENITALKMAQERMHQSEQALLAEKAGLEEANTALKILLHRREQDRRELEEHVMDNVRQLVLPVTKQLAELNLSVRATELLDSLERRLSEVTKPFLQRSSRVHAILTPQEIEVATLIQEGMISKKIAERLNISVTTVNFHRANLRKKLQLQSTRINLRSYLMALLME